MTDVAATSEPGATAATVHQSSGDVSEPGERGRLDIAEQVVEHVATIAAGEVRGVRTVGSSLSSVVGRQYPKAKAQVAGGHARVHLDIAVAWPSPLASTAAVVRDRVRDRLHSLVGVTVDAVDVTIASVMSAAPGDDRRVQ